MIIISLHIEDFRLFNKHDFKIGKYVTAVAGFNTTGKSTILGLLGHCGQLRGHRPLLHSRFRTELSEILKFSVKHDDTIDATISFDDIPTRSHINYPSSLSYRSSWQKYQDGTPRYRIFPKRTKSRKSDSKIKWPTLYLGLGRLYPVGESVKVDETKLAGVLSEEENKFILNNMTAILNTSDKPKDFTALSIVETKKKKAIGVNTDNYDSQANSAGQDNLGQILMAILSFRRLKQELGAEWYGGLLLVDELDAALHPLAQNKLLDFLYVQAKDIGFQVAFTTHSLSLLEYLSKKTAYNSNTDINKYELVYLKKANGPLEIIQNPQFEIIYYDLMATYDEALAKRVSVFSEDEEARILIKKMLDKFLHHITILEASFGNDDLLKMLESDYYHFCNFVFILDGDVPDTKIQTCTRKAGVAELKCALKLPGGKRPEQVLWEYIDGMPHDHPFLKQGASRGISLTSLREQGPYSKKYNGLTDERDKFKNWFKDNRNTIETVVDYWCKDNKEIVDHFVNEFVVTFNWIASRNFIPRIIV